MAAFRRPSGLQWATLIAAPDPLGETIVLLVRLGPAVALVQIHLALPIGRLVIDARFLVTIRVSVVRLRLTDPDADARKIDADALCEGCSRRETRQRRNTREHGQPFLHGI